MSNDGDQSEWWPDAHEPPPAPPPPLRPASFVGGIRSSPFGWGGTAPFGHLDFDEDELAIWGLGVSLHVRRGDVLAIRLSNGIMSTRVTVIDRAERESSERFYGVGRPNIKADLETRGWPVIDDHTYRSYRHAHGTPD